jgi:hypothetical protein
LLAWYLLPVHSATNANEVAKVVANPAIEAFRVKVRKVRYGLADVSPDRIASDIADAAAAEPQWDAALSAQESRNIGHLRSALRCLGTAVMYENSTGFWAVRNEWDEVHELRRKKNLEVDAADAELALYGKPDPPPENAPK